MSDIFETLATKFLQHLESLEDTLGEALSPERKELLDIHEFPNLCKAMQRLNDEDAPVKKLKEVSGVKFLEDYNMLAYLDEDETTVLAMVVMDDDGFSEPFLAGGYQLTQMAMTLASYSKPQRENTQLIFYSVDCTRCDVNDLAADLSNFHADDDWEPCERTWEQWARPVVLAEDFQKIREDDNETDILEVDRLVPGKNYAQVKLSDEGDNFIITGDVDFSKGPVYEISGDTLEGYNWPECNITKVVTKEEVLKEKEKDEEEEDEEEDEEWLASRHSTEEEEEEDDEDEHTISPMHRSTKSTSPNPLPRLISHVRVQAPPFDTVGAVALLAVFMSFLGLWVALGEA